MKKKVLIVLLTFIALITFSALYVGKTNHSNTPGPNNGDSDIAKNYVEDLAKNIILKTVPVYEKSFDEGCETSRGGSSFEYKTDKRCTYRHISAYSAPNYETLNELKIKVQSDNWIGNGQNVIMDTEYFRNNGATYYRYDGPLAKNANLSVDYYGQDSERDIERDIRSATSYDSGKLDSLTTVKSKLNEPAVDLIIVDIKYGYFWGLY